MTKVDLFTASLGQFHPWLSRFSFDGNSFFGQPVGHGTAGMRGAESGSGPDLYSCRVPDNGFAYLRQHVILAGVIQAEEHRDPGQACELAEVMH